MKHLSIILSSSVMLIGTILAACTTGTTTQPVTTSCGTNYSCMKDMAFQYRQQAAQLSAIAQRYEMDAAARAADPGQDTEVKHQRELAAQYRSEAKEADELAHEYFSQLPHNVIN